MFDILPFAAIGRLLVGSCQSQAFEIQNEVSVRRIKEKGLESEDDDNSSSDGQETNDEQELPDSGRPVPKQRSNINASNFNLFFRIFIDFHFCFFVRLPLSAFVFSFVICFVSLFPYTYKSYFATFASTV